MAETLVFYKGYDNPQVLELKTGGVAQDLAAVSKVEVTFNGNTYDSDTYADAFDWTTDSMELVLRLGLIPGIEVTKDKKSEIVTYDPSNPNGFVWGRVLIIMDEVS